MDAHDELFYRLNDPDPHTQVMAELDLILIVTQDMEVQTVFDH